MNLRKKFSFLVIGILLSNFVKGQFDPSVMASLSKLSDEQKDRLIKQYGRDNDPITNVMGGAFMPHISKNGKLLYSLYKNGKYNIALIEKIDKKINKNC